MKFRTIPVFVDAVQWFKDGDHLKVTPMHGAGDRICEACDHPSFEHGWCSTTRINHSVCVGDWIVTDIDGGSLPCKPDIFAATYEPAE